MKLKPKVIITLIIILILFVFQMMKDLNIKLKTENIPLKDWYWNFSFVKSNSNNLTDNKLLYEGKDDVKVNDLYLVILPTNDEAGNPITFDDINRVTDFNEEKQVLNAYLVNTDSKGINTIPSKTLQLFPNATINLRGHSTMLSDKKSYKVKLGNFNEKILGYEILNLNKHPYDEFKVRNRIAFELFQDIPDFISFRTELFNLYIKDMTNPDVDDFIDYGLFTHIEQPNQMFLKDHNLDTEGFLYKAEFFEFFKYDAIRNMDDPLYNEHEFTSFLEPKVGDDHEKIIKMLEDVNNYNLDINKVLDKHFNRDNYFTWLAVNILLGNYDTKTQNFFLYSRHDNLAWYILPWDYDGGMMEDSEILFDADGKFQAFVGVSNYWNSVLHNRVFRDPNNLTQLNNKIEEISKILTKEKLADTTLKYFDLAKKEYSNKTLYNKTITDNELKTQADNIISSTIENKRIYFESLEKPMPVYLFDIEKQDNGYLFHWEESFDLQGDRISYKFQVSETPSFTELVFEKSKIRGTEYIVDLPQGEYFWRVIIMDEKGNSQRAHDQLITEDGKLYHGLKQIIIE